MAAHRYWALALAPRPGGGGGISVAEVEWRASSGGADLCVGGTASGTDTGGFVAANAFDNDNGTYFYNGSAPQGVRLAYDFTAPVTPVEVWLRTAASGHPGNLYAPSFVRIDWSDDGVFWNVGYPSFDTLHLGTAEDITVGGVSDDPPTAVLLEPTLAEEMFPQPAQTKRVLVPDSVAAFRPDYGGYGRIAGDVKIKGMPDAPVRRIVRLVREIDAICVAQQWSDPITGAYEFLRFDPAQRYTVLAYDELGGYRAAIASNVVPELMTV